MCYYSKAECKDWQRVKILYLSLKLNMSNAIFVDFKF